MALRFAVILYFGIPIAALVFFAVSLFLYCHGRHRNKVIPSTVPAEKMHTRKICLIISSVIAGILAAVVLGIAALLMLAVAFM